MKSKIYFEKNLKKLIEKELKLKISLNSKIHDYEEWDSLANFNILLATEKFFKINFDSKEFTNANSFKEIINIVKKKIKVRK